MRQALRFKEEEKPETETEATKVSEEQREMAQAEKSTWFRAWQSRRLCRM